MTEHAFEYIRKTYGVPARKGGIVIYSGGEKPRNGLIVGAEGQYLLVKLGSDKGTYRLHPTWKVEYVQ